MNLNETPSANRTHIAFFGRRNAGKSSLVNAVTGQQAALVSDIKGTTTDPVYKSMELLPMGPVVIIDTPGFDDEGELGGMRVKRARQVLNKTDIAVLVMDAENKTPLSIEDELINLFKEKNIPYIIVLNKIDKLTEDVLPRTSTNHHELLLQHLKTGSFGLCGSWLDNEFNFLFISAKSSLNINLLKEKIASMRTAEPEKFLVRDLIKSDDFIVLVIPIDKAAPKGRLILPQQQMIRDILEAGASAISVRESELEKTLANLGKKPSLVITDSQVFAKVSAVVPPEIPLTSFSILFARYKGFLETAVKGACALDNIKNGDEILVCEGCTHHRQCDDIGTVKIPRLVKNHCKSEPEFCFTSGGDFPQNLSLYKLIIHCGSCMLNEREMRYRQNLAADQNIAFTNYGIAIAHMTGILERSIAIFK